MPADHIPDFEIHVQRQGDVLVPCSEYDAEMLRRHHPRVPLRIDLFEMRSIPLHRMYWAVLRGVVEGTGRWASPEILHDDLKEKLGFKGRSTSFKKMSAEVFRDYCRAAFDLIQETIIPHYSIEEIAQMGKVTLSQEEQSSLDDPGA